MLPEGFIPNEKSGDHSRAGAECKKCDRRRRCGRHAEEFREHAFASCRILIEENADRLVLPERLQYVARCTFSLNRNIAAGGSIMGNEFLNSRVIDRPDDKL